MGGADLGFGLYRVEAGPSGDLWGPGPLSGNDWGVETPTLPPVDISLRPVKEFRELFQSVSRRTREGRAVGRRPARTVQRRRSEERRVGKECRSRRWREDS